MKKMGLLLLLVFLFSCTEKQEDLSGEMSDEAVSKYADTLFYFFSEAYGIAEENTDNPALAVTQLSALCDEMEEFKSSATNFSDENYQKILLEAADYREIYWETNERPRNVHLTIIKKSDDYKAVYNRYVRLESGFEH